MSQIASALWPLSGDLFFNSLVEHLRDILLSDYVCVGEFVDNGEGAKISLIACFGEGKHLNNFEYTLSGTPCEQVMRKGDYWVTKEVATEFPKTAMLRDLGIEGYVGLALRGTTGSNLGLLSVLFKKLIVDIESTLSVLKIFAAWVSAELTRSKAEETLHRYYQIVDSSADLLALVDSNYTYQAVNPAYLDMFGKRRDQIIGQTPTEVFGREVFEEIIKPKLDECLKGNETKVEFKVDLANKPNCHIQTKLSPFLDPNGNTTGVVICGHDITSLKQTEEVQALRASTLEAVAKCHVQRSTDSDYIVSGETTPGNAMFHFTAESGQENSSARCGAGSAEILQPSL